MLGDSTASVTSQWEARRASGQRLLQTATAALAWPSFWVILVLVLLVPTACFLVLAFAPRLFDQGSAWFTLSAFRTALQGVTLQGMGDSLLVGALSAVAATAFAVGLAWVLQRTTFPGRRFWNLGIWAVLLVPSYIMAVGWEVVLSRGGILSSMGVYSGTVKGLFFGPAGYTLVLAVKGMPFAYFAVAGPLANLGHVYEDAAHTHGAGRFRTLQAVGPILLPALFAAMIIVFAESISDFGTAAVMAPGSNFPIATYTLYSALVTFPAAFPVAAVVGWMLVLSVSAALLLQGRFTRGRSYAVLHGRAMATVPRDLVGRSKVAAAIFMGSFFVIALLVPILGAIGSSLLTPFTSFSLSHLTLSAYSGIFTSSMFRGAVVLSLKMALINACLALVISAVIARKLTSRGTDALSQLLDLTLLAAIALPGIVLAAGYIFAYNLPLLSDMGIHIYGTLLVLGMAYLAGALPSTSRVLMGSMAQVQGSLLSAARVHGASAAEAWWKGVLPLLATGLVWAFLFTFSTTFLELPASELLAPPGQTTVSVAILYALHDSNIFAGTALSIVAMLIDLGIIAFVLAAFRLLSPQGWRRLGARAL